MLARASGSTSSRRGIVVILTAFLLIVLVSMVAFAVDIGYMRLVQAQLQAAADSTALAAAGQLTDPDELTGSPNQMAERMAARIEAQLVASMNQAGGKLLFIPANTPNAIDADLVLGYMPDTAKPNVIKYDAPLFNCVQVKLRRDVVENGPLQLFFSPVMGFDKVDLITQATAVFETGIRGFRIKNDNTNCKLLPFTLHVDAWNEAFVSGTDDFAYNEETHVITEDKSDGIKEVKLFPATGTEKSGVTPGNFGTIDIGSPSNSTSDLARQILEGPNLRDFSFLPEFTMELGEDGSLSLNGDTGISAGMKDELDSILGEPRIIPLYSSVSGNGNNSQFVIVQFVGIRILEVRLTGSLSKKHVTIQPAFCVDGSAVAGGAQGTTSRFITMPLALVK